ncbi:glycosyl transferase [Aureococcus anophagefferens]|nr:glycosyl transferase [Aureococcus anophagefferens]
MRRKQALDWSGETEEPNNQLMLHPMASAPWQSMKSVYDPGEGVYAPVQQELSRHGLTARCDRPRLGLKWPEKDRIGHDLLPRVRGAQMLSRFRAEDGGDDGLETGAYDLMHGMADEGPLPRLGIALMIWMYFDAPHEDEEAVAVAEDCATHTGGAVVVHRCSGDWWKDLRKREASRFLVRGDYALRMEREAEARGEGGGLRAFHFHTERRMIDSLETGDVQARQAVVVDLALCEAQGLGLDWCFHIDVDELFYCPAARHRTDARRFFAERVPKGADQVRFLNLEILPEKFRVDDDWFSDVDLFKINKLHCHGLRGGTVEQFRAKRRDARRKRRERMGAAGDFDVLRQGSNDPTQCPESVVPEPFAEMLEDGNEIEEDFSKAWAKAKARAAEEAKKPKPPRPPSPPPDDKSFGPKEDPDYDPYLDHIADYFNAYENGKSACRLRPRPARVPLGGVHGFLGTDGAGAVGMDTADMALAPVILHYANCGFDYWKRKYEVLGDFPDPEQTGDDEEERPGMADEDPGDGGDARRLIELFYRTWIAQDQHGEKPYLAAYGLLERVPFPRRSAAGRGRVVYDKAKVVSRCLPSVKSAPATSHDCGDLVWGTRVTPDGFVVLSDPAFQDNAYLLIDATHLGHGVLLERVHPPELEPGACKTCFRCPCYCALLDSYDAQ